MRRFAFAVIFAAAAARAQQPDAPGRYVGVASCVSSGCHGATVPLNAQRIRQNEYYTWLHSDRHAQAYNVLFNTLSKRIAKNMRLKATPYQEKVCLDCHSTNVPKDLVSGRIAQALHPKQDIRIENFRDTRLPEASLDGVIGNVPFADVRLEYRGQKLSLHDFFFAKSIDALKPAGVLALVTP